jgi:hypothetical protein
LLAGHCDIDEASAKGDLAKRRSAATWFAMIDPADRNAVA